MMSTVDAWTLAASHAIRNVLAIHSRGVDRGDGNLLGAAYHADATVDYGFFAGEASTLVSILAGAQAAAPPTMHRTAGSDIRVSGAQAVAESYVIAAIEEPGLRRTVFGRYLDRFRHDGDTWRIAHRIYVLDGNTNRPGDTSRADPPVASDHFVPAGGKGASDAGRALLAHHDASTRMLQKVTPMAPDEAALDAALAREAIRQLVAGYCRGVDRADAALLASIFWEDATVISGIVNGTAPDFARDITAFVRANMQSCFHSVANEWIKVRGDHAVGEHYVIAHARAAETDSMTGGRYIDRYERRDGVWKIASRAFVSDGATSHPTTYESGGFYEALTTRGCFGREDLVYGLWSQS